MKISMKRLAALVLAVVMVIGLLPVMDNAVNAVDVTGLTDGSIGVSYVNAGQPNVNTSSWTASGNAITGNLQGVKRSAIYMAATSTLTITNNKSAAANLSFDYSITTTNGSSATIDGETVTGGSFAKKLASGESVAVVLSAPRTTGSKDNTVSISITNLILASASNDPVTTTFEAPAFGSYTVAYGDQTLTVAAGTPSQAASNLPSVAYTLTATPGAGYKMVGWYNATTDSYLGTGLTYIGSFEEANTIKAVIVPDNTAVFLAGENYFSDLNEAVTYAQAKNKAQITLVQSGILPEGAYTIPAGITLLIPMDSEYTPTRTDDEDFGVAPEYITEFTAPYAYLTLTMADGAELTVNGTLDIESRHTTYQGGKTTGGRPCGAYGAIYMNPEASISVGNGGNLYAWGYIYGEGNVTANSGSKVYEIMQVTDFPGGSNMSQFVDTDPTYDVDGDGNPSNDYFKTFPFSQYYVQNIEVALTLKSGAAEYVYITMTAGGQSMGLPVRFIGEGGMFVPGEGGSIVKDYDPSTDRLNVTVNGDASMAGIALDLTGTKYEGAVADVLGTSKVDSASFILTLNGNITINIASGTTTVKQDLSLLPGVEINIAESATLVVAERSYADGEYDNLTVFQSFTGYNIYVWDLDNWGNFVFKNKPLVALTYSPTTGRYTRTADDLKDVRIDINGTVICEGYIYSTVNFDDEAWVPVPGAGAAVISTGKTGTLVLQNGPGPEEMAYCLDGYSDKDSAVFVDSVWLLNGDGTYVLTEGCEPGTTYNYCDVHDLWYTEGHGDCIVVNTYEITWVVNGQGAPEEYLLGDTPFYKGATPTKPANGCTVYTFAGWATSVNGEVLAELPAVTGEATYFAVFTEGVSHTGELDYTDNGDTHSAVYDCCGAEYVTGEGHTYTEGLCACGKKQTFTIKWNNNGTIMETDVVEYGEVPVYNGATPTKTAVGYTYTFTNWSPAVVAATKDMTYNAVYSASVNSHFVILKDENGTELGRVEYEYNVIISQNTLDAYAQKKCYTLDDWYYENGQSFSSTRMGDEDIVLIAKWNGPNHSWVDADCDNDGYCSVCGEAGDPALGHSYNYDCDTNCSVCGKLTRPEAECVSDAEYDCQDGNCIYCGESVSASENHDWLDATCTEAATCGNCGATTGSALGHGTIKGWDYVQIDNDVHQVWCKDCHGYSYDDGHDYVNHVCSECSWTERMSVKFYNGDTLWRETTSEYGGTLGIVGMEVPAAPTGYEFAGWYAGDVHIVHGMTVTEDIVAYATWAKLVYTVTWNVDGIITTEPYEYGAMPSFKGSTDKASDGCTTYTFDGWDKDIVAVTGNVTYTAEYTTGISHTGELEYTHVDEWVHKVTWSCCGAVVSEEAEHEDSDNDGYCDCGGVFIKILVNEATIYGEEMENRWQYIFVKPGSTYTTDVGPATGWGKVTVQIYDAGNDTSVINRNATQLVLGPEYTSAVNEDLTIFVYSYAEIIIDLNGGDVIDEFKETLNKYDPENGIAAFDLPVGAVTEFDMLKDAFVREGYTLIGITDGQTTYTGDEDITSDGEDLHLTLVWKADHVCSENLTEVEAVEADCDTNGVKAYWSCSCGKYYADANASTEIPDLAAWKNGDGKIEKLGHGHTAGLYYEEDDENHHTVFCNDCDAAIKGNVKCTDAIDDGDHKCDFCPNENITGHSYDPATHECECGALETFTVTWLLNGGVIDEQWKQQLISEGFTVTDTSVSGTIPYGDFAPYTPGVTKNGYILIGYTDQYGNFNEGQESFTLTEDMTYTMVWECAHSDKTYTDLGNGFHKVTCDACSETLVESEDHDYTYDARNHKCQCGAVEKFKLTVVYGVNGEYTFEAMLPYWTRLDTLDVINNIPWRVYVNDATHFGYFYLDDFYWDMDGDGDLDRDRYFTEGYIADRDMYAEARYDFNGFVHDGNGWKYRDYGSFYKNEMVALTMGDVYENGSDEELEGIYMVGADGYRIENGMGRWYYLGYNPFSGITYEPNAEDIAYYENKGQTFIDKEMTWYYFGADGKLAENYTGLVGDSYVINGQAAWHIGLVEIDGEYYYFKGDEVNGGNKMVVGCDAYLYRNNTSFNMVVGGIYTFDNDGKMQWKFHGIVESELFEGKRHYIGGRLTPGLGLVDLMTASTGEVRYFYVDSYGQLILDAEYYIGANSFGLAKGIYYFDAEGFLVMPEPEVGKNGLFFEDGKWYYYVDGAKAYCAGLIEIDGNWVYVRSDGSLATGVYYVTNTNNHATIASGTKCTFDDNGVMIDPVINMQVLDEGNCTIEDFDWDSSYVFTFTPDQDAKLTIDVFNIVLDDEYENVGFVVDVRAENYGWLGENFVLDGNIEYYVSGNMGQCWVYIYPAYEADDYSNTVPGTFDYKISFGNDGAPKNGIIDGYYYVDGHIAYAAGLIEIDGIYYYVRSNGQIVTDCQYWITNVNDTGYEPGLYEFDVDGWMSEIYVETFTGIKDGYFYVEDKIAYNAGLKQYDGGYIYVRSNGQIATGKYWITNHNGLLPEGFYDFGEDGIYYPPVPENAYLVKDVVKNTETDGFYGYLGTAEGILPQADGMLYIEVTDITYAEEILNAAGFDVFVDSSDYWAAQFGPSVVGTATIMMPVTAGKHYVIFVNPADIDGEDYSVINGTISYKIWSTVECELKEVSIGQ